MDTVMPCPMGHSCNDPCDYKRLCRQVARSPLEDATDEAIAAFDEYQLRLDIQSLVKLKESVDKLRQLRQVSSIQIEVGEQVVHLPTRTALLQDHLMGRISTHALMKVALEEAPRFLVVKDVEEGDRGV